MSNCYYEKLYKIEGHEGKVFRMVSEKEDDVIFGDFIDGTNKKAYWIEDTPKLVSKLAR